MVRAVIPVLGLRAGQTAELTDTPFLGLVLKRGWLETVSKTEAKKTADAAAPQFIDPDITKTNEAAD